MSYDGEREWAYYYTAEGYTDYIFATLPVSGSSVPTSMMHSAEDAYQNAVLHITEEGTYILEGDWHGQVWIDLGDEDDTFADETAKVTLVLNGVDVTCTVAPSLVFYSVYECDNTWEDQTSWSTDVDTSEAGANVIIADGTENNFTGENIFRILKTKLKDEQSSSGVAVQKKRLKMDGAFYSYVSMNIDGETEDTGVLNITAGYEGLGTELHFSLNGGNVNIFSQDDSVNVNEDGVSVFAVNDGSLHVMAGLGSEGDGIDSNGYAVINGGTVISMANPNSDSGLDSDCGTYVNGGTVLALGSTMDWVESDNNAGTSGQASMNLQFASSQSADEAITLADTTGKIVFAYDPDKDEVAGARTRSYKGAIVSGENIQVGGSYFVYVGCDVTGTEKSGVYDVSTVTGLSSDAQKQCYTGTSVGGGMGGGFPGGGGRPGSSSGNSGSSTGNIYFTMTARVNDFSGVTDYTGTEEDVTIHTHSLLKISAVEATHEKNGNIEYYVCSSCGKLFKDSTGMEEIAQSDTVIAKGEHVYGTNYKQDEEYHWKECECGSVTEKAVHSFGEWTVTKKPTVDEAGSRERLCSVCVYKVVEELDKLEAEDVILGDVPADSWKYEPAYYVYQKAVMKGKGTDEDGYVIFAPDDILKREEVAQVLYNMEVPEGVTYSPIFEDVADGNWYSNAVVWAAEQDIVKGYGEGMFGLGDDITREQLAVMLYNYAEYKGYDVSARDTLEAFPDADLTSSWAKEQVQWAVAQGIINGNGVGIEPLGTASRAECAAMLKSFLEIYKQ